MYQLFSERCTPVHFEKKELKGNPGRESLSGTPTQFLGPRRKYRSGIRIARWVLLIACLAHVASCSSRRRLPPSKKNKKGAKKPIKNHGFLPGAAKRKRLKKERQEAVNEDVQNVLFEKRKAGQLKEIKENRAAAQKVVGNTKRTHYVAREERSPRTVNGGREIRKTVNAKKLWFTMKVKSHGTMKQAFVYLPNSTASPGLLFTPKAKNKRLTDGSCFQEEGSFSWDRKTYYKVLNFSADLGLLTLCESEPCPSSVLDFIKKKAKKAKGRRLMDRLVRETFRASEE
jgi:hypothetical protein